MWRREQKAPPDFNWLYLAEIAEARATIRNVDAQTSIGWALVALSAYAWIQREFYDVKSIHQYSVMHLRSVLIARYGAVADHKVLDPAPIVRWFFDTKELSYNEALGMLLKSSSRFPLRPRESDKLFHMKQALAIIRLLPQNEQFQYSEELRNWMALEKLFP